MQLVCPGANWSRERIRECVVGARMNVARDGRISSAVLPRCRKNSLVGVFRSEACGGCQNSLGTAKYLPSSLAKWSRGLKEETRARWLLEEAYLGGTSAAKAACSRPPCGDWIRSS